MNSAAFNKFLTEYHAEGKAKADGYTLALFDRMSEGEREKAFELLTRELQDSLLPIEALVHIDSGRAKNLLVSRYADSSDARKKAAYPLHAWLWHLTHEPKWVSGFIACQPHVPSLSRVAYITQAKKIDHPDIAGLLLEQAIHQTKPVTRLVAKAALVDHLRVVVGVEELELRKFEKQLRETKDAQQLEELHNDLIALVAAANN